MQGAVVTSGDVDFYVAVDDDAPRVELLSIVHDNRTGLLDDGEYHDAAQSSAHRQRHVRERPQVLRKFEQDLDVIVRSVRRVLLQALAYRVPNRQTLRTQACNYKIYLLMHRLRDCQPSARQSPTRSDDKFSFSNC